MAQHAYLLVDRRRLGDVNEFMADQSKADFRTYRPLLDRGRAQWTMTGPMGEVLARQLRLTNLHSNSQACPTESSKPANSGYPCQMG